MPNETDGSRPAAPSTATELERLINEAEGSVKPVDPEVASLPQATKCSHAFDDPTLTVRKCKRCHILFCETECGSILDPDFCRLCMNEKDAELKELPLIDEDGVQHEGRHLQPDPNNHYYQPRFGTLAKTLCEMTDPELDAHVARYKDLVHQAEIALDFRRIMVGSATIEQAQRADRKRRQLRADKTKYPVKILTVDKKTGEVKKKPADMAAMLKMMEMLAALNKTMKDSKDAKAKDTTATKLTKDK